MISIALARYSAEVSSQEWTAVGSEHISYRKLRKQKPSSAGVESSPEPARRHIATVRGQRAGTGRMLPRTDGFAELQSNCRSFRDSLAPARNAENSSPALDSGKRYPRALMSRWDDALRCAARLGTVIESLDQAQFRSFQAALPAIRCPAVVCLLSSSMAMKCAPLGSQSRRW